MFAQGVGKLANLLIINQLVLTYYVSPRELQTYFGILKNTDSATKTLDDIGTVNALEVIKRKLGQITNGQGFGPRFVGVGVAVTLVAGIAGLTLFAVGAATDNNPLKLAGAIFLGFALAVGTIAGPLLSAKNFVFEIAAASQISKTAALTEVLGSSSEVIGMTKTAAIVGLVISVGIPWGIFMYQALSGGVKVGTMAFNAALATAIASTIVTLIMFALSLTVVGFILTAVLGFVDLLNTLLCEAGISGACFSLVGSVTSALASLIYSSGVTINFDHKDSNGEGDLVRLGSLGMRLRTSGDGFVDGNSISYYAPVNTTLYHKRSGGGAIGYYDSYFNANSLRSSTFRYWLQGDNFSAPTVARNDMSSLWQNVYEFDSKYYGFPVYNRIRFHTGYANQNITSPYFPLAKGLNQRIPLNLYMRYAVTGYECWTAACKTKTLTGDSKTSLGDNLYFDVFPTTVDEFYTLAWSSSFGAQLDHDGDGLLSRTASSGGLDPNDSRYDTDSDKLPDGMEVRLGTSNSSSDSDGDGLGDYLEAILGTDATRTDTDRDGLTDAVEVNGWQFTYATGLSTLVTTDPRLRDTDSDGLSDSAEFNLGTNPRAKTESPVGIDLSISDQDRSHPLEQLAGLHHHRQQQHVARRLRSQRQSDAVRDSAQLLPGRVRRGQRALVHAAQSRRPGHSRPFTDSAGQRRGAGFHLDQRRRLDPGRLSFVDNQHRRLRSEQVPGRDRRRQQSDVQSDDPVCAGRPHGDDRRAGQRPNVLRCPGRGAHRRRRVAGGFAGRRDAQRQRRLSLGAGVVGSKHRRQPHRLDPRHRRRRQRAVSHHHGHALRRRPDADGHRERPGQQHPRPPERRQPLEHHPRRHRHRSRQRRGRQRRRDGAGVAVA